MTHSVSNLAALMVSATMCTTALVLPEGACRRIGMRWVRRGSVQPVPLSDTPPASLAHWLQRSPLPEAVESRFAWNGVTKVVMGFRPEHLSEVAGVQSLPSA